MLIAMSKMIFCVGAVLGALILLLVPLVGEKGMTADHQRLLKFIKVIVVTGWVMLLAIGIKVVFT